MISMIYSFKLISSQTHNQEIFTSFDAFLSWIHFPVSQLEPNSSIATPLIHYAIATSEKDEGNPMLNTSACPSSYKAKF